MEPSQAGTELADGAALFARYAYPPNAHGYCGPADSETFFALGTDVLTRGGDSAPLRARAREFDGAWPFLRLLADATGRTDPLDPEIVEAYWLGSPLLDQLQTDLVHNRLGRIAATANRQLSEVTLRQSLPHHSFAVFCIYPWADLLNQPAAASQALQVLDRCRIRTGRVIAVDDDRAEVESRTLTWDGERLGDGPVSTETVIAAVEGVGLAPSLRPGDWVSLHWEWVCDLLSDDQRRHLDQFTDRHRDLIGTPTR